MSIALQILINVLLELATSVYSLPVLNANLQLCPQAQETCKEAVIEI